MAQLQVEKSPRRNPVLGFHDWRMARAKVWRVSARHQRLDSSNAYVVERTFLAGRSIR